LLERVGEGATAEVFRARDHRLDRTVAIKVLRPQYGANPDARERFAIEARSAAALAVPNIVPVYDFGATDDGSLFIAMRFIDGLSLRELLAERGGVPPAQAVDIGRQIAEALAAAHEAGLIHRDVKPGNILIDRGGRAHLADFGTVKMLAGEVDLTRTGVTFGTAAYLAPEQVRGERVGPRADVYALGVVLYQALTGRPPFTGDDPIAVSYAHVHEQPMPVGALVPNLDPQLERLVMACLAKAPADRPATAREVADVLGQIDRRFAPPPVTPAAVARVEPPWEFADHDTIVVPVRPRDAAVASLGVAPGRPGTLSRSRRRSSAPVALAVLLLAALVVLVAAIVPLLIADRGASLATATTPPPFGTPTAVPAPSVTPGEPTISAPVFVPLPLPTATPFPTLAPTLTPTAQPTPTPAPTPAPTPRPTAEATPQPTAPPATQTLSVRIPDQLFVGDYNGPGSGTYKGRTASWVYGQDTSYSTMTAAFALDYAGSPTGRAQLTLVGMDAENPAKQMVAISINGTVIYQGPDPLPNDFCCGPSGPGNWGSATITFPSDLLKHHDTLTVTNLDPGTCTLCPNYVMVDYAELQFRVAP
jgi:eukaryotic-like serine/threonine-protein kinase